MLAFSWILIDYEERRYGGKIFETSSEGQTVVATILRDGFEQRKHEDDAFIEIELTGMDAFYAKNRTLFFIFLMLLALGMIRALKLSD